MLLLDTSVLDISLIEISGFSAALRPVFLSRHHIIIIIIIIIINIINILLKFCIIIIITN